MPVLARLGHRQMLLRPEMVKHSCISSAASEGQNLPEQSSSPASGRLPQTRLAATPTPPRASASSAGSRRRIVLVGDGVAMASSICLRWPSERRELPQIVAPQAAQQAAVDVVGRKRIRVLAKPSLSSQPRTSIRALRLPLLPKRYAVRPRDASHRRWQSQSAGAIRAGIRTRSSACRGRPPACR
jgi:hypothetical protein